ncbi:MAG: tRNA (guanine(46)-N(7))-methyltransferase TrmB [Burkholderiaceae bacterium]
MTGNSRTVSSIQDAPHQRLAEIVARHAAAPFRKPVAEHGRRAFETAAASWHAAGGAPLILDAGCGVGLSTRRLARRYPDHFVLGVDRSADRLGRQVHWDGEAPANMLLLRADLVDFWRLVHAAGIRLARHYLLYPNPYPKPAQVQRRWHAHAVFPTLLALGGVFECRSNWRVYVDEMAAALRQAAGVPVSVEAIAPCGVAGDDAPLTPFEEKYAASGHALWRCAAILP